MNPFGSINDSISYEIQKQIIRNEINWKDPKDEYIANQAFFKKTREERALVYNLKHQFRERMRAKFSEWTRRTSGRAKYLETKTKYTF